MINTEDRKTEDSLKKRYFFKLSTNMIGLAIGIGTQTIVPRALGPAAYGDFSFLTGFFQQVVGFLNFSSSTAYYTKLSQRQEESRLVIFYFYFILLLGIILAVSVGMCIASGLQDNIWPSQSTVFVLFGAAWAFMTFCAMVLSEMSDAYGLTLHSEMVKMAVRIFGFLMILLLLWKNWLSLFSFFTFHFATLSLTILLTIGVIRNSTVSLPRPQLLPRKVVSRYATEFITFCSPLVLFSVFSVSEGLLDRWFLQKFSGSIQQGFYGLSYQIGSLCFIFTGAMTPLFARELSIAFGSQDVSKMAFLFRRYIPLLYAMGAYLACFISAQSDKVAYLLGGESYAEAALPISIMAFYPLFQTYGQLSTSLFYATGQTALLRNIGILSSSIGIPMTYFFLAPNTSSGLDAGAAGLASKMVIMAFISINSELYFNTRYLGLNFWKFFAHQFASVACMLALAFISTYSVDLLFASHGPLIRFTAAGFAYTLCVLFCIAMAPSLAGLTSNDVRSIRDTVFSKTKLRAE